MNSTQLFSVITTIQAPTPAVCKLSDNLKQYNGRLIIAGDKKGPSTYRLPNAELLTMEDQLGLPLKLPRLLPQNHYVRKNVAYLHAISHQAPCIFETDDDNAPLPRWALRTKNVNALEIKENGWCNVYAHFSKKQIWPRGYPLDRINESRSVKYSNTAVSKGIYSPIQQGLADGNPDVDAIWRLLYSEDIRFSVRPSLALKRGVWCPFNSQNAWWWPEAYPLLYLPSYCTFRMTDIWRSFIAQRCLWELDGCVTFHAPDMIQDRNVHNLMRDFQDEVPGYLTNDQFVRILEDLPLDAGVEATGTNLLRCYETLVENNIFPKKELALVKAWLSDLKKVRGGLQL